MTETIKIKMWHWILLDKSKPGWPFFVDDLKYSENGLCITGNCYLDLNRFNLFQKIDDTELEVEFNLLYKEKFDQVILELVI